MGVIVNRLQREVQKLQKEKAALEKQLSQYARSSLDPQLSCSL
jgi:uncharacterized protein YlxW (UPF0749 family)